MNIIDKYFEPFAKRLSKELSEYPAIKNIVRIPWLLVRNIESLYLNKRASILYAGFYENINRIENEVRKFEEKNKKDRRKILYFGPSTRTTKVSFHSLVGLIASWALRMAGNKVTYLVCNEGLSPCMIGTDVNDFAASPNCGECVNLSKKLYNKNLLVTLSIDYPAYNKMLNDSEKLSFEELKNFKFKNYKIGEIVLRSVRWRLRGYHIEKNKESKQIFQRYLASAVSQVVQLEKIFKEDRPDEILAFNGTFYPEAVLREVALAHDIPVVTYESGHDQYTAFFSHDIATKYEIEIPKEFQMNAEESKQLNHFQELRRQGSCFMGGGNTWSSMEKISQDIKTKSKKFKKIVPIFTNVVFDTSQIWADCAFENMFEWLSFTMKEVRKNPETLFVVRAHPAEMKMSKKSQEPVGEWLKKQGYLDLPNVYFVSPEQKVSSYDLIDLADFCIVYNSTIGLECVSMGKPIVCGGLPKYANANITNYFYEKEKYTNYLQSYLIGSANPFFDEKWRLEANRFFYYLVFKTSLKFSDYIEEPLSSKGFVVRNFSINDLVEKGREPWIISKSLLEKKNFYYEHS